MAIGPKESERRRATRVVPPEPVTVRLENGRDPVVLGLVDNISETGACVRAPAAFPVGDELLLALHFAREGRPLSTTGRVVWQEPGGEPGPLRHGVQWTHDGPHRVRLHLLVKAMVTGGAPRA
jgi:Tfp pilus assembly protein PilZ